MAFDQFGDHNLISHDTLFAHLSPFSKFGRKDNAGLWSPPSTSLSISNSSSHPPLPGGLWKCGSCGWETWRRVTQGTLLLCIGGKNREILQVHIFFPEDRIEIVKSNKRCFLFWCLGNRVTNNSGEWLSIIFTLILPGSSETSVWFCHGAMRCILEWTWWGHVHPQKKTWDANSRVRWLSNQQKKHINSYLWGTEVGSSCLAGYNGSVYVYGQTGAGKTHTMWGCFSSWQFLGTW